MRKMIFFLLFGFICSCTAQTPQWVTTLIGETFPSLTVGQITHWEEKQMTWYHIDGVADGSDSVRVNTLYFEGLNTANQKFIGAIPVTNQQLNALGSKAIAGQTCTGMCGCQCCKFRREDYGCLCDAQGDSGNCCASQPNCSCWCQHTLTDNK
jgi:hypothetical protein